MPPAASIGSSCDSIGSPPIRPVAAIRDNPILAFIRKSSKNFTPKNLTTSAGITYSPSLNKAGTSSRTSSGNEPIGTSFPLIGSRSFEPPISSISICSFIFASPPFECPVPITLKLPSLKPKFKNLSLGFFSILPSKYINSSFAAL